mmetsp:Transcript_6120/g.17089  ORF Transcript_6120/g.17089 Transcript_6120/m.17089 type:complete len:169 (-) Transcript_6120:173-679(-)|eukprot:CAMPEP_0117666578 /NCGR_PEP_ID=MMETSP0804-20121206/10455_1 /TAXON_ID=1074897 /ORGANISM="Tetraselmis astigmatica, Strain CCMP880" /LENGTH=168 /DNA_ID=CAMNT_0005474141 /DNA_START=362 /DNA_END=868 /DNA_ORIENTATION=+
MASWFRGMLLCVVLALAAGGAHGSPSWKPCGPQKYFDTRDVQILPDPPVTGEDITFNIWGTTDQDVKGGVINIDIGYMGIHLYTETKDLCAKTACPIPANKELELVYVEKLPAFIPPGSYDVTITVTSVGGAENLQLFCMDVKLDVVSGGIKKHTRSKLGPNSGASIA